MISMGGMFNSSVMVCGEILLGISLTVFVGALIAACGNRMASRR
jgi:hypothetical protein